MHKIKMISFALVDKIKNVCIKYDFEIYSEHSESFKTYKTLLMFFSELKKLK